MFINYPQTFEDKYYLVLHCRMTYMFVDLPDQERRKPSLIDYTVTSCILRTHLS